MIKKTIGKLRRQPKKVREGIAFWFTCAFVFMVASVWLLNLPAQFADMRVVSSEEVETTQSFFEKLNNQTAAVRDSMTGADSESASSSAGLGNESLDTLVNQFRERASSSSMSDSSSTARSSEISSTSLVATSSVSGQTEVQSTTTASAPLPREVRIITTASSSASSSIGR